jgi:hypothetical protein
MARRVGRSRMVKGGLAAAVAAVAVAATTGGAAAAPAVPGGETSVFDAPAGEFCAFPVRIAVRDGTKLHTGTPLFSTGPLAATITNLATGASATFNASGPTFKDSTLAGTALIGQPASRNVGAPFLIVNRGRVTFTDNLTIATITGSRIDVCAALS